MTKMTSTVSDSATPLPFRRYAAGAPRRSLRRLGGLGAAAALVLAVAGCGDDEPVVTASSSSSTSSTSSTSSSPSSSSSSSSSPAGRTLEVTVTGRSVDPAPSTVQLGVGESLTLRVTSDHDDELHIHGFEIEEELKAGTPTSVTLTGKDPGVYEVETHHPELRLLKIAVQ